SRFDAEYRNVAFASEPFRKPVGRDNTTLSIVGRNVGQIIFCVDTRIKNRDRYARFHRAFDDRHQRVAVRRREHDSIDSTIDRIFDDVDLPAVIGLLSRSLPDDLNAKLFTCGVGSSVDALPEEVGDAFWNHSYSSLARGFSVAVRCEENDYQRQKQKSG